MEFDMNRYLTDVNYKNVNARLDDLYRRRDTIGEMYDKFNLNGWSTTKLDCIYDKITDTIKKLCDIRSKLKNCLLEGDPGYGFNSI